MQGECEPRFERLQSVILVFCSQRHFGEVRARSGGVLPVSALPLPPHPPSLPPTLLPAEDFSPKVLCPALPLRPQGEQVRRGSLAGSAWWLGPRNVHLKGLWVTSRVACGRCLGSRTSSPCVRRPSSSVYDFALVWTPLWVHFEARTSENTCVVVCSVKSLASGEKGPLSAGVLCFGFAGCTSPSRPSRLPGARRD